MGINSDIYALVDKMEHADAKRLLYNIFIKFNSVGYGGYTKEQCLQDVERIYTETIIDDMLNLK